MCGEEGAKGASVEHYLLHCPEWSLIRESTLSPLLNRPEKGMVREARDREGPPIGDQTRNQDHDRDRMMGIMLLGGRRGTTQGGSNDLPRFYPKDDGDRAVGVAQFIQKTWARRMNGLFPPRGQAQPGTPVAKLAASTLSIVTEGSNLRNQ